MVPNQCWKISWLNKPTSIQIVNIFNHLPVHFPPYKSEDFKANMNPHHRQGLLTRNGQSHEYPHSTAWTTSKDPRALLRQTNRPRYPIPFMSRNPYARSLWADGTSSSQRTAYICLGNNTQLHPWDHQQWSTIHAQQTIEIFGRGRSTLVSKVRTRALWHGVHTSLSLVTLHWL